MKRLTLTTVLVAVVAQVTSIGLAEPPYPPSSVIKSITWHWDTHTTAAPGSDLWPVTWASDGDIYAAWGDGGGFGGTNSDGRVSMGFARIKGVPESYVGINVNGGKNPEAPASFPKKCKTGGILSVDGTLYARLNLQDGEWPNVNFGLAWSEDLGATWTKASWVFPKGAGNFRLTSFLNFGRDYAGVPAHLAGFVYFYGFKHDTDSGSDNSTYMGRVSQDKLKDRSAYEFFKGLDANGKPIWTSNVKDIWPMFTDANGSSGGAVVYNPGIKRYIMTSFHTGPGQLGIFDAPQPWGPWTTVAYYDSWGNMGTTGFGLNCDFPQKWMSTDGLTMWSIFSVYGDGARKGIDGHDKFNLVKATLMLPSHEDYGETKRDNDGQPVPPLLTGEYVTEVTRVALGGCSAGRFGEGSVRIPTFASEPQNGESRTRVAVRANRDADTQAWQVATAHPAAWRQANDSGTQSSGNGTASSAQTIQAPYPSSPVVRAMRLDWSTHQRFAQGSDNFQLTWADDDHLYGAWGDGGGFGGTNDDGRVSLGVARVEGPWNNYSGYNVWGGKHAENPAQFKGKSWGMICIKGILYMWVVPDYSTDGTRDIWHYSEARLAKSTDHGAHWTKANWAFFESENLIIPTICNFGKHYADARDNYVYHYFICPQDNLPPCDRKRVAESLIVHKPGRIYLARVDRNKIFDSRDDYEFFVGLDRNGLPKWGSVSAKQPVFEDKRGTGWCMSVSYNPGLGRYILCTEHTESSKGNLGVFDAPEPWGPWTTIEYVDSWGKSHVQLNTFFWSFPTKWLSNDGREVTLGFTGAGRGLNNDSFNTVRGRFIVKDASGRFATKQP